MRDEEFDEDNGPGDRRADTPAFPIAVKLAGIAWIGFGAVEWIAVILALAQSGANQGAGGRPQPLTPCCPGLVGLAFLVCGYQTVTGKTKDTLGNSIGSILLGLLQLAVGVAIGLFGVAANNRNNDGGLMGAVLAAILGLLGAGLIAAGVLALVGRSAYRDWRRSQKAARLRRSYDDDDDEDDDRNDRRRRRRRPRRDD